ncbi:MAG: hypothetical protein JNL13_04215 [Chitinophagaceae bacterium]|nr:hypothetical protein [Chitinophagaceae bacterium]
MKKPEQPNPRPIPNKPEITDPSKKEQKEINREKKKFDTEPGPIEKPEIPQIPPELPEEKPGTP